jgi:prolyl-tRNA synthetase
MVIGKAKEIDQILKNQGIGSLVDSRDIRPGEKYFEWEKKGIPVRVELGPKDIANDSAVLVRRDTGEKIIAPLNTIAKTITDLLTEIQKNLYDRALEYKKSKTKTVDTWDDFVKAIDEANFVLAHWSGEKDVEAQIKKETGATIRCIPFDQPAENGKCVKSGKPSAKRVLFAKSY